MLRREKPGEPRVEREDGELVKTDKSRNQLQDQQLVLKGELVLGILEMLLEQLFGKPLRIVDEVECRKVQRVRRIFLPFLPVSTLVFNSV